MVKSNKYWTSYLNMCTSAVCNCQFHLVSVVSNYAVLQFHMQPIKYEVNADCMLCCVYPKVN